MSIEEVRIPSYAHDRLPARETTNGFGQDLTAEWARLLRKSRRAFASLMLDLPPVYRDFVLDGDLDGPRLGHRWPLVQLDACFRRLSSCEPVREDPATARILREANRLKRRIDRAREALLRANLRLAMRIGKPVDDHGVSRLKRLLAAASGSRSLPSIEAGEVWEVLRWVASRTSRNDRDRELRENGVKALSALTPEEEKVLRLRFGIGHGSRHTFGGIANDLGLSSKRARQIERSGLLKLCAMRDVQDLARRLRHGS
jgi:hypothetical protein